MNTINTSTSSEIYVGDGMSMYVVDGTSNDQKLDALLQETADKLNVAMKTNYETPFIALMGLWGVRTEMQKKVEARVEELGRPLDLDALNKMIVLTPVN